MPSRITHIGIVVHDIEAAISLWRDAFGFVETHREDIEAERVRTAMLSPCGTHGEMAIELMEPMDKGDLDNPIARHLHRAGEGFYHLAMVVDDVEQAREALTTAGATMLMRPPATLGASLLDVVDPVAMRLIVHPRSANGVLVELLQGAS